MLWVDQLPWQQALVCVWTLGIVCRMSQLVTYCMVCTECSVGVAWNNMLCIAHAAHCDNAIVCIFQGYILSPHSNPYCCFVLHYCKANWENEFMYFELFSLCVNFLKLGEWVRVFWSIFFVCYLDHQPFQSLLVWCHPGQPVCASKSLK